MGMRVVVKRNDFPRKPPAVKRATARGTLASAERIAADARTRYSATPGETGEMRDETTAAATGPTSAAAESASDHALYQDQGTRYVPATYFFSGAAEAETRRFGTELADEITGALGG